MIGKRLAHYEITGELGQGGMGEVYRAVDTRLEREVAIKILPAAFAQDEGRLERFGREAKVLAALDHPNIASIFGVESFEGQHCLILQLVEGETLAERIARGPLAVGEALAIAKQMADALAAAHERGVIHRDLKPSNVKIADNRTIKVLDFGLAKLSADDPESKLGQVMASTDSNVSTVVADTTQPGMVLGTPAYMSPEQTRGLMIDQRTDVWAFGCCLFEMLSGRKPFQGQTSSDLMAEVLKAEPDWSQLPADTPAAVLTLIRRCLEKELHRRLRSTGDIAITLEETSHISRHGTSILSASNASDRLSSSNDESRPLVTAAKFVVGILLITGCGYAAFDLFGRWRNPPTLELGEVRSIAVLPFETLGGGDELLVVANGLEEQIREDLRRIDALDRNIGARSVKKYTGSDLDERAIAAELEVDGMVYGSIRQLDGELDATIHLVHGPTANTFWTTNISTPKPMLLKDQITLSLLEQFNVAMQPEEEAYLKQSNDVGIAAYTAYRQGLVQMDQYTPEAMTKAVSLFEKAIELDANFLPPYISLSWAHWLPTIWGGHSGMPQDVFKLAKGVVSDAEKVFADEPDVPLTAGYLRMIADFDWRAAKEAFDQALIDAPESPEVYYTRCWYLLFVEGRYNAALRSIEKTLEFDPERVAYLDGLAEVYTFMGDEKKGLELNSEIRDQHPNEWDRRLNIAINLKNLGLEDPAEDWLDRALSEAKRGVEDSRRNPSLLAVLAEVHAARNETAEVESLLKEIRQQEAGGQFVPSAWIARVEAQRGNLDAAVRLLERAYERGEGNSFLYNMRKLDVMTMLSEHQGYWELVDRMAYPFLPIDHPFHAEEQRMRSKDSQERPHTSQSLIVLPFVEGKRGEEENAWLALMIQDRLVQSLRELALPDMAISPGEARLGDGTQTMANAMAAEGVDGVIYGKFDLVNGVLAISPSFLEASIGDERPLELQSGSVDTVFDLIDQVVRDVVESVRSGTVIPDTWGRAGTIVPGAAMAYWRGIESLERMNGDGMELARTLFDEAMRLDPTYVAPYLALEEMIWRPTIWGQTALTPEQSFIQANALLAVAERHSPRDSKVLNAKAFHTLVGNWDWSAAYEAAHSKGDGVGSVPLALYLALIESRFAEARVVLDGLATSFGSPLARVRSSVVIDRMEGDWGVSLAQFEKISEDQMGWQDLLDFSDALLWNDQSDRASELTQKALELSGSHPLAMIQMAVIQAQLGRSEEAVRLLDQAKESLDENLYFPSAAFADGYLALGDRERALEALEAGLDEKGSWKMLELRRAAYLEGLGGESRYWELVKAMAFPELPIYHRFRQQEEAMR